MSYAVENWGGGGDRIVLVHGSLGVGAAAFGKQKPLADTFALAVMTRRGYGDTAPIDAVDVLRDAADVIELLGDGAHLVGTSMGGIVAMNAAGRRPDLVRSLTVIEPPAFALASDLPPVRRVAEAMRKHWATADRTKRHAFVTGFLAALEMNMPMPDPLPPPVNAAAGVLVTERPWGVDVPVGAVADARFPKLVVTGGWSEAFDGISGRLADLFNVECHCLQGAGHAVQKVGEPFNALLRRHIASA
ncbi:alpha/beta hydrolase family protein [Bradyrhizobium macuxiense]|uniref:Alpha/beta hydrolase family protein n=1 Tax=Bradyrhizobium macuxiense TaxID=1755647 RepID=A0A560LH97_9BRAD|nr:alpha/beta hydrolase [Bradyrhizobium macuxiense]TWB94893.1 alpha/beta hydrolase family protein [Bradyrhizobium macuxiense]